jgi:hypothetical protein
LKLESQSLATRFSTMDMTYAVVKGTAEATLPKLYMIYLIMDSVHAGRGHARTRALWIDTTHAGRRVPTGTGPFFCSDQQLLQIVGLPF